MLLSLSILSGCVFGQDAKSNAATPSKHSVYTIEAQWDLPKSLREVSGIAWLSENKIATVQDEEGIIFIYDLSQKKVVDKIPFGEPGDYEGIALHQNDAYVMRSDGRIFEIKDFLDPQRKTTSFATAFTTAHNIESLTFEASTRSLIIAPKDKDRADAYKGLYRIPLSSQSMEADPFLKIKMNDPAFKDFKKKKVHKTFRPSDVAIHPKTGDFYILDAVHPKLIIMEKDGTVKKVYELEEAVFAKPEGITFSPAGTLYISNEEGEGPANILKVSFP